MTSIRCTERLAEAAIEPSVGSRGNSYDSALAETINGLSKPRYPGAKPGAVHFAVVTGSGGMNGAAFLAAMSEAPC